jgi:hypothetical protein
MLANKLAKERGGVETAIRHTTRTPAEGTSVQPEEDKRRRGVCDG